MATLMLDVDGVLLKADPLWTERLESELGMSPERLVEAFFKPFWPEVIIGKRDLFDALDAAWPALGTVATPKDLVSFWFRADARVVEPVLADCAVIRASGHKVCLATNQEHHRARFLMETAGLSEHVDGIRYSAELGAKKPDPAFFSAAQIGFEGPFVFVDDTAANVAAAQTAGWARHQWSSRDALHQTFERLLGSFALTPKRQER